MNEPSQIDWARLAALIDGEGCLGIERHVVHGCEQMYIRITVANTDPRIAAFCQRTFGGNVLIQRSDKQNSKWRPCAYWYVTSKSAASVLEGCLSYFIAKRDQAEVCLTFQSLVKRVGVKGHNPENLAQRAELKEKLMRMKKEPLASLTENGRLVQ